MIERLRNLGRVLARAWRAYRAAVKRFDERGHPRPWMTSPGVTLPVPAGRGIKLVRIEPRDWTPTKESRRSWLEAHYPGSEIQLEALERE